MKNFSFFILFLLLPLSQCAAETDEMIETNTALEVDIDLSKIEHNYIDLSTYTSRQIRIGGHYQGDRIVLQNTSNMEIVFVDCTIKTTHIEDALVFADENISNLDVTATELMVEGGGLTFWGRLDGVYLHGGTINDGHTGIRATKDVAHNNLTISDWHIYNMTHEGIYMGVSQDTPLDNHEFHIFDNTIEDTGWDAIQVGNVQGFYIHSNKVTNAGNTNEYGQDYGVTINPGSLGYLFENNIQQTVKPIQILNSRVFFHAP